MAALISYRCALSIRERIFGKDWRVEYVILFNDSSLVWFKEKQKLFPEGGLIIKDCPELMAFGKFTSRIPHRPELPQGYQETQLLAFGTRGRETVHWLLCKSESEVGEWISVISNTLPPPPQPPDYRETNGQYKENVPLGQMNAQGIPMENAANTNHSKMMNDQTPPPPYTNSNQNTGYQPNSYPLMHQGTYNNPYPAYNGYFPPSQPVSNNTTVVVQDRHESSDLAMGLMVAGYWGWGHGYGWGHGGGWSSCRAWGRPIGFGGATDVHIENHYDLDNTTFIHGGHNESVTLHDDNYDAGAYDGTDFDACADFVAF